MGPRAKTGTKAFSERTADRRGLVSWTQRRRSPEPRQSPAVPILQAEQNLGHVFLFCPKYSKLFFSFLSIFSRFFFIT